MCLVSVVMPFWNAENTIRRAVESILSQTLADFELVLVDDGSEDDSVFRISDLDDTRIRLTRIPHGGVVVAMNVGLEMAKGEFVARMDSDDVSHPTRLEKQVELLVGNSDIGLVGSLVNYAGDRESQAGYARYVDWTNQQVTVEDISLNRFVEFPYAHPTVLYRRELIDRYGAYRDGDFPEDYELILRWLDHGVQMCKVPEPLVDWFDLPSRLSRTDKRYGVDAFYQIKAKFLANWLARNNPHHPDVIVWGAGRTARLRARMLEKHGIHITGYIDIDPKKTNSPLNGVPRYYYEDMPSNGDVFVLTYVGSYGAREFNHDFLVSRGFEIGKHFIHCS